MHPQFKVNLQLPPIEIPEPRKAKGRLGQIASLILILGFSIAIGFGLSESVMNFADPEELQFSDLIYVILVFPTIWLCIIVHEAGHLIAGLRAGFKFYFVQSGPFRVTQTPRGLRLRLHWNLFGMKGMTLMFPTAFNNLKPRALWYYAGGPLASFIGCLIVLGLFLLARGGSTSEFVIADIPILFFIGASLLFSILTMIPSRSMHISSDGARIFSILLDRPLAKRDLALLAMFGQSYSGVRPRDWDEQWITESLSVENEGLVQAGMEEDPAGVIE